MYLCGVAKEIIGLLQQNLFERQRSQGSLILKMLHWFYVLMMCVAGGLAYINAWWLCISVEVLQQCAFVEHRVGRSANSCISSELLGASVPCGNSLLGYLWQDINVIVLQRFSWNRWHSRVFFLG